MEVRRTNVSPRRQTRCAQGSCPGVNLVSHQMETRLTSSGRSQRSDERALLCLKHTHNGDHLFAGRPACCPEHSLISVFPASNS